MLNTSTFTKLALATFMLALSGAAPASDPSAPGDEITIQTNLYNVHFSYDEKHRTYSPLLGAELRKPSGWLYGGAVFINSFGQFSQVVYGGHLWEFGDTGFYGKVTAGIIHGYQDETQDKLPYNHHGFAPGVIPALGYKYQQYRIETQLLGLNGMMVTAGVAFKS